MSDQKQVLARRTWLGGAATAGAAAAASALLPSAPKTGAPPVAAGAPVADDAGGYRLSEHVKRYYATARV